MASGDYLGYGGNTCCISIDCGERMIVFDAGTGLAGLGLYLKNQEKEKRLDIFFSHAHIDHMIGLFGFSPFYDSQYKIHLYGEERSGMDFKKQAEILLGEPYWPVGLDQFQAEVHTHQINAGEEVNLDQGIRISAIPGFHPGGSTLYRLEGQKKSLVYGLDCEINEDMWNAMIEFSREADMIIWDAQYTPEELKEKRGWGHSSWEQGIEMRKASGAKRIMMIHYSWEYADHILKAQEEMARAQDACCCFAKEGMEIVI